MSLPLRVRRLTDEEGRQLQRIVRRGGGDKEKSIVKWRRAMVVLASGGGNTVPVIADLVQTSDDRVREMIHRFNEIGMDSLDPQWAGGRPRLITTTDRELIVKTAKKRPRSLGQPFTRWSIRKLRDYLATKKNRKVMVSRERLRQILAEEKITFQKTKTWKESNDPFKDAKLARIDHLLVHERDRTFAFDEFGPLAIKPDGGSCWAQEKKPQRLRANYHKPHGTRQFFGCYSIGQDELFGVIEKKKGWESTLRALQSIRKFVDDGEQIYVILDNLNHHKKLEVREWCEENKVELAFTPTYSSWANPIEAHFGPLREFVLNNSDYDDHAALARAIRSHLKWRNSHKRDPKILAAEHKARLRVRSETKRRWGYPPRRRRLTRAATADDTIDLTGPWPRAPRTAPGKINHLTKSATIGLHDTRGRHADDRRSAGDAAHHNTRANVCGHSTARRDPGRTRAGPRRRPQTTARIDRGALTETGDERRRQSSPV